MSPKFQEAGDVSKGQINGPRPSPLRINKDSHAIHKPSSSLENTSSHASVPPKTQNPTAAKRQPVIIYTHSPKIIHAQARDFMALVQKLTGYTRSEEDEDKTSKPEPNNVVVMHTESSEDVDHDSSSALTTEEKYDSATAVSPLYGSPYMPAAADVPLFTPNSHLFQSPSFGNAMSPPSFMDFMKGFGEY